MNHKLTIEGATAANVDAALGMLAPGGGWRALRLSRNRHLPLPPPDGKRGTYTYPPGQGYDARPGTLTMPAPAQLTYRVIVTVQETPYRGEARGSITAHELGSVCHIVFTDGRNPENQRETPAIGADFDALADALAELLQGKETGTGASQLTRQRPPNYRRGPTDETVRRAHLFKTLKDAHPEWGQVRLGIEAARVDGSTEGYSLDTVRNTYRAMREWYEQIGDAETAASWQWEPANRIR